MVFIGGLGGTLLKTTDTGSTWMVRKFGDLVDIRGISFSDSLSGWLIDSRHVYRTYDGGERWDEVQVGVDMSTYFFMDIVSFGKVIYLFLKPQTAVLSELVHSRSQVIKSTDGGISWGQVGQEIKGKMLSAFFMSERVGFVYAEETVSMSESSTSFYKTADGGVTWTKSRFPEPYWAASMFFLNEHIGFLGKYRTSDGGISWIDVFSGSLSATSNVGAVFLTDSLHGWSVMGTRIAHTSNGGLNWEDMNQRSSNELTDIGFSMNGTGWIVGWAGNILWKRAESDYWETLSSGIRNDLNDVFFVNRQEGWCVGTHGSVLHTSNAGNTWENQETGVDSVLFAVRFLNNLEGWIVGHNVVLHTTNGGVSWKVRNDLYGWYVDIDFFDCRHGLLIERSGSVLRTMDGGATWHRVNDNRLSERLTSLAIVDEEEAWIGGWQGMGRTTDRGSTVQWYSLPQLSLVQKIQFVTSSIGFLSNDRGAFFETTDGGWIWHEVARGTGMEKGLPTCFFMRDMRSGWLFTGIAGGSLKRVTLNPILSVVQGEASYSTSAAIHSMFFFDPNEGWAVGDGGTILRYELEDSLPPPLKARINVFPNPLSGEGTFVIFELHRPQEVAVDVFNILGQKVQRLHKGFLNKGEIMLRWLPGDIPPGAYFISVRSEELIQTQRCILFH